MKKRTSISEAGSMMVSAPGPVLAEPGFKEMVMRELSKLRDRGQIPTVIYSRAVDILAFVAPTLYKMFYKKGLNLNAAVVFLIRKASH